MFVDFIVYFFYSCFDFILFDYIFNIACFVSLVVWIAYIFMFLYTIPHLFDDVPFNIPCFFVKEIEKGNRNAGTRFFP